MTSLLPPTARVTVRDLSVVFGPGCDRCDTGEDAGTNRCERCGTVWAVRGANLEVGPGETVGIVGESGCGKTTLLRTLAGVVPPTHGEALVGAAPPAVAGRDEIVMVHQNPLIAGLALHLAASSNVAERLLRTGERDVGRLRARSADMLAELGIDAVRHPDQLATFSGGMQQRVQLARALVNPPTLLLLDEPTTGLDPSVQADLLAVVQDVSARLHSATVVVSHDLDVVRILADRVLVMHHGEVVEQGVPGQILTAPQHRYTRLLVSSRLA